MYILFLSFLQMHASHTFSEHAKLFITLRIRLTLILRRIDNHAVNMEDTESVPISFMRCRK